MLALSPHHLFSTNIGYNWPFEDAIGHHEDQNYFFRDNNNIIEPSNNSSAQSKFPNFSLDPEPSDQLLRADRTDSWAATPSTTTAISCDVSNINMAVKKFNHNASERDRRKKINHSYSSLRSLLPQSDHTKKLSIPATVSRVLKYVPELQKEVEGLIQKKEELLSRINNSRKLLQGAIQAVKQEINSNQRKIKSREILSLYSFSTSQLNDKEVALQISSCKFDKNPLSEILQNLEGDGFVILNASSFESFEGRLFHNLHLQVDGSFSVEYSGSIGETLMPLCDNKKELFL